MSTFILSGISQIKKFLKYSIIIPTVYLCYQQFGDIMIFVDGVIC